MNFCRFLRLISVIVTLTLKRQFFYINNNTKRPHG